MPNPRLPLIRIFGIAGGGEAARAIGAAASAPELASAPPSGPGVTQAIASFVKIGGAVS
jgi:hypothetical protein